MLDHELILKLKREGFKFMIQVNGESIKLYDDVIVKYELLRVKEIDYLIFHWDKKSKYPLN